MLLKADARQIPLKDESVHCVVCSPPYWALRDYGLGDSGIGLEKTPELYVDQMVQVFPEVKRVLRPDGTLWINLGDCWIAHPHGKGDTHDPKWEKGRTRAHDKGGNRKAVVGLKHKDLVGLPWRVAFALQADGWYLRQEIIWHKPNPMPESVQDRPTRAHEQIFLLSKSRKYFYDSDAIREPASEKTHSRGNGVNPKARVPSGWDTGPGSHRSLRGRYRSKQNESFSGAVSAVVSSRNKRSVWTIPTQPVKESHFSTFPEALVEPCILAGTSEKGRCPECGAPWKRITETAYTNPGNRSTNGARSIERRHESPGFSVRLEKDVATIGWKSSCSCDAGAPKPCVVLDPFVGSGTTVRVAERLGRVGIGCDLAYQDIARRRTSNLQKEISFLETEAI